MFYLQKHVHGDWTVPVVTQETVRMKSHSRVSVLMVSVAIIVTQVGFIKLNIVNNFKSVNRSLN